MQRIEPSLPLRPTLEAKGYLEYLKKQGIFPRMVDGYVFAAAFAMEQDLPILPLSEQERQELVIFGILDEDVRLALEIGVHILCQRRQVILPSSGKEALEIVSQYGEAGLKTLKEQWQGQKKPQIQKNIRNLLTCVR